MLPLLLIEERSLGSESKMLVRSWEQDGEYSCQRSQCGDSILKQKGEDSLILKIGSREWSASPTTNLTVVHKSKVALG